VAPGKPSWEDGFLQQFDVPTLTPGPKLKVGHFPLNLSIAADGKTAVEDDGRWGNRGRGPFATENRSNHEDRRMATWHRRFLTAC
jgi:hypothetical protein